MSVVTYWLSRRRFIGERWWERKAEAYSDIIGNLTSMIHSLNLWIEYLESEYVQPGREGSQEMVAREYREARDRVERVSAEGAYVISEEASSALSELVWKLSVLEGVTLDLSDFLAQLDDRRGEVKSCLEFLRRDEAKRDLKVNK